MVEEIKLVINWALYAQSQSIFSLFFTDQRLIVAEIISTSERLTGKVTDGVSTSSVEATGTAQVHVTELGVGRQSEYWARAWDISVERAKELESKTPDQILKIDNKNFSIQYLDVDKVTLDKHWHFLSPGNLVIESKSKKYIFNIGNKGGDFGVKNLDDSTFEEYSTFLKSILNDKFEAKA